MKKGIALLITMGFLTILTAIITYMFSITNGVFDEAVKVDAKNQRVILFRDIKTIIDKYANDIKNGDDLSNFLLGMPPFYDKKSDLSLHVEIKYLSNKVNLNSLLVNKKVNKNIVEFLKNVGETYNILDVNFFIALLEDTIDEDEISRLALSEISIENIKFSNSSIVNMKHFEQIVEYYINITQDKNILNVPWTKLIFFGQAQSTIIDCDKMSKELVNAFRLNIEDFTGCGSLVDEQSKKISKKFNLKPFSKENNLYVLVKILYQFGDFQDDISFVYDLKTQKVE